MHERVYSNSQKNDEARFAYILNGRVFNLTPLQFVIASSIPNSSEQAIPRDKLAENCGFKDTNKLKHPLSKVKKMFHSEGVEVKEIFVGNGREKQLAYYKEKRQIKH